MYTAGNAYYMYIRREKWDGDAGGIGIISSLLPTAGSCGRYHSVGPHYATYSISQVDQKWQLDQWNVTRGYYIWLCVVRNFCERQKRWLEICRLFPLLLFDMSENAESSLKVSTARQQVCACVTSSNITREHSPLYIVRVFIFIRIREDWTEKGNRAM